MTDIEKLKAEFHEEMLEILAREREVGFSSGYFRRMVYELGGYQTAKKLLEPDRELPPMFEHLRKIGRLDLTMENRVVKTRYNEIFSDQDRKIARFRLKHGE